MAANLRVIVISRYLLDQHENWKRYLIFLLLWNQDTINVGNLSK